MPAIPVSNKRESCRDSHGANIKHSPEAAFIERAKEQDTPTAVSHKLEVQLWNINSWAPLP